MEMEKILAALRRHGPEMVAFRHDLHMHPETCYEEHRTAAKVLEKLNEWGIEATTGIAGTGIVAVIRGSRPGNRAIGLRADMDALNMVESNTFAHRSTYPNKMHGCGHDGHTTMLLGAARYLKNNPDFAGTVNCFFQPAEEGGAGGLRMIEEGLFQRFPCDSVYSLHNKPGIPVGKFVTRSGPQLACADSWTVTFQGTGGHGGAPEKSTDTTIPLAQFILGIQTIIARNVPALESAVLSIGTVHGGLSFNVMPSEIVVTGTTRCHKPEIRDLLEKRLTEIAQGAAAMSHCTVVIDYQRGYPPLINTRAETDKAIAAAAAVVGIENVDGDNPPINAADDFAYMLRERPGCNVMMGNGDGPQWKNNHMPGYDFNDEAIPFGSAYWISIVNEELNQPA
ncbi:MAG: hydrolase [Devosia sp.]|uniref:M20 aminoacylase family protein n=1 Tax=Devosia sp. TaxID=1871048 RepID=UPI0026067275|nr:M20 aminoacylase family protein [Devosia sp.]MDB5589077.1 hydrolase [Devosia sp.]